MTKSNNQDFAVFIITHGRADNIKTIPTLNNQGYTGPVYLILDVDRWPGTLNGKVGLSPCVCNWRIADPADHVDYIVRNT